MALLRSVAADEVSDLATPGGVLRIIRQDNAGPGAARNNWFSTRNNRAGLIAIWETYGTISPQACCICSGPARVWTGSWWALYSGRIL